MIVFWGLWVCLLIVGFNIVRLLFVVLGFVVVLCFGFSVCLVCFVLGGLWVSLFVVLWMVVVGSGVYFVTRVCRFWRLVICGYQLRVGFVLACVNL